jgi:hypothetical protein
MILLGGSYQAFEVQRYLMCAQVCGGIINLTKYAWKVYSSLLISYENE